MESLRVIQGGFVANQSRRISTCVYYDFDNNTIYTSNFAHVEWREKEAANKGIVFACKSYDHMNAIASNKRILQALIELRLQDTSDIDRVWAIEAMIAKL